VGDALGEPDGLGLGEAEGRALGDGLGEREGLGEAEALGEGDACVTVIVVTPFWVVALTSAPDAPMSRTPETAPAFT